MLHTIVQNAKSAEIFTSNKRKITACSTYTLSKNFKVGKHTLTKCKWEHRGQCAMQMK